MEEQKTENKIKYYFIRKFDQDLIGKILIIAFIVLKLTNTVDWSWWWILVPLVLFF